MKVYIISNDSELIYEVVSSKNKAVKRVDKLNKELLEEHTEESDTEEYFVEDNCHKIYRYITHNVSYSL
jgi:hypothetical protein